MNSSDPSDSSPIGREPMELMDNMVLFFGADYDEYQIGPDGHPKTDMRGDKIKPELVAGLRPATSSRAANNTPEVIVLDSDDEQPEEGAANTPANDHTVEPGASNGHLDDAIIIMDDDVVMEESPLPSAGQNGLPSEGQETVNPSPAVSQSLSSAVLAREPATPGEGAERRPSSTNVQHDPSSSINLFHNNESEPTPMNIENVGGIAASFNDDQHMQAVDGDGAVVYDSPRASPPKHANNQAQASGSPRASSEGGMSDGVLQTTPQVPVGLDQENHQTRGVKRSADQDDAMDVEAISDGSDIELDRPAPKRRRSIELETTSPEHSERSLTPEVVLDDEPTHFRPPPPSIECACQYSVMEVNRDDLCMLSLKVTGADCARPIGNLPVDLLIMLDARPAATDQHNATKINAMSQTIVKLVGKLQPGDRVMVMCCGDQPEVVVPLSTIASDADKERVGRSVRNMRTGRSEGFSMKEAVDALRGAGAELMEGDNQLVPVGLLIVSPGRWNDRYWLAERDFDETFVKGDYRKGKGPAPTGPAPLTLDQLAQVIDDVRVGSAPVELGDLSWEYRDRVQVLRKMVKEAGKRFDGNWQWVWEAITVLSAERLDFPLPPTED
ncbi:hypothetical protein HDV00_001578 [Rhizophlyctis rosea]|nr:hypothetical protein HDV00_001578 [Rhizophlyctis rosea]